MIRTPIHHEETKELLGYVAKDTTGWQAQTIFGYPIERVLSETDAEAILREKGLSYLMGIWQYFDTDDRAWYPCVIKEAMERRVAVIRTNEMGYQDPDTYKLVFLDSPD